MAKTVHILLIILVLGFFGTPAQLFACDASARKTEKSCCKAEKTKTSEKKCCKNHQPGNTGTSKECDGTCGHTSCNCAAVSILFALHLNSEIQYNQFCPESKSFRIIRNEIYLSSGFTSIWLPPKIS